MHGHLVIADISGYTRFLTESELEHANGIISELLNAVIGATEAPLTVSSIEGDAVFLYGTMPEGTSGQAVLESVELLYTSFASALETMILNTTCKCNACANINALGLKIVMHCGEYVTSEIGGRETVSGPDVIVAHRLLKNHIRESTGIDDYMLVTQACVDDLGIEAIVAGWVPHVEEYEHVGEVKGYVSSLPDVWEFVKQQTENKVVKGEAWLSVSTHSQAPPAIVWDHLIDPFKRTIWMDVAGNHVTGDLGGRIGPGSAYHCAHGDGEISIITVLDMKTANYVTFVGTVMVGVAMTYTTYLIPSGSGTRIVSYAAPLVSIETGERLPDDALAGMASPLSDGHASQIDRLVKMADAANANLEAV